MQRCFLTCPSTTRTHEKRNTLPGSVCHSMVRARRPRTSPRTVLTSMPTPKATPTGDFLAVDIVVVFAIVMSRGNYRRLTINSRSRAVYRTPGFRTTLTSVTVETARYLNLSTSHLIISRTMTMLMNCVTMATSCERMDN